jgi:hypothetical protein
MIKALDAVQSLCRGKNFCLLGNASSILRNEKPIDDFDVVGRMNRGDPHGKEKFIGSRTDILFLSTRMEERDVLKAFSTKRASLGRHPIYPFIIWMTVDSWLASAWTREHAILNPWKDWCELYLKVGSKPTTGLMAINFLLNHIEFKELTIYGFDFFKTPSWYNTQPGYRGPHDPLKDKENVLFLIEGRPNVRLIDEA